MDLFFADIRREIKSYIHPNEVYAGRTVLAIIDAVINALNRAIPNDSEIREFGNAGTPAATLARGS